MRRIVEAKHVIPISLVNWLYKNTSPEKQTLSMVLQALFAEYPQFYGEGSRYQAVACGVCRRHGSVLTEYSRVQ